MCNLFIGWKVSHNTNVFAMNNSVDVVKNIFKEAQNIDSLINRF